MQLPRDLLTNGYTKPKIYLCEVDKTRICELNVSDLEGSFEFNKYSEISFSVGRTYLDEITGETRVHPFYDKIEALRLIEMSEFGYFQLQDPEIEGDGISEIKNINAYSLEYDLSQKYLELFTINMGTIESIDSVVLYDASDTEHSLLHLAIAKAYGWTVGHVDASLQHVQRSCEIDRESIYDFLMNEVSDKFNCVITFNTFNNTINVYAESLIEKFYGDGSTTKFTLTHTFATIGSITINGYKTNAYTYNAATGEITFNTPPSTGDIIEVVDGYQEQWSTDVFISFDNLAQKMNVSYSADDIKTVLTVTGADDLSIREVNMGLPYIVDLSYYYTVDWMGQDLYDAYTDYLNLCNSYKASDTQYRQQLTDVINRISYLQTRVSTQYVQASVTAETVGTYYLRGGSYPSYYYTEVKLPEDYNSSDTYYKIDGVNLTEEKLNDLLLAIEIYLKDGTLSSTDEDVTTLTSISDDFSFVEEYSINDLISDLRVASTDDSKKAAFDTFLAEMWEQYGQFELNTWKTLYNNLITLAADSGWSEKSNEYYYKYFTRYILMGSAESAVNIRTSEIDVLITQRIQLENAIAEIGDTLLIENNFTPTQLTRLSPFLREDEYSDENILITDSDSDADILRTKQQLKESGQIELQKLCQPNLSFKADMANIYALPEFAPIIHQFQLGNLIRVALRPDYIKRSRLMKVDINFEDFSDFSCEFGDLSSVRSATDIHADLLAKAVKAGKSVASNASYWSKGVDKSNSIDIKLQQGLLDAITSIKSIDGTQNAELDKYGIHLRKLADGSETEYDPEQIWMINNKILFTDDNFKTSKTVLGKFRYNDEDRYGLLADAIISGYVAGSEIEGGTIKIGERQDGTYNFEVDENGVLTFRGGEGAAGDISDLERRADEAESQLEEIQSQKMYRIEVECLDRNIMTRKNQTATLTCKVYSWDEDITSTLDASLFNWIRVSNDQEQDEIWNSMAIHQGVKTLTISTEDIVNNASFSCQVNIPD